MAPANAPGARTFAATAALAVLAIAHLVGCLYYFPYSEIASGEPAMTSDYSVQYLSSLDAAHNLRRGSFLGYTTRWAAGSVSGFPSLANNRPLSLVLAATPDRLAPLVFNLTIFVALWLAPLAVYGAARTSGAASSEAVLAAALAVASWYGSSFLRLYWRAGSVVFVLSAIVAVWIGLKLPAIWRSSPRIRADLLAAVLVAVAGWLHSLCVIAVAIVGGAGWLAMKPEERRPINRLLLMAFIAALLCSPWLSAFAATAPLRRSLDYGIYLGGIPALLFDVSWGFSPADWQKGQLTVVVPLLMLALAAGPFAREERRRRDGLWLAVAGFAALAYLASYVTPLRSLQPYRFVIPMMALLMVLAAPLVRIAGQWRAERAAAVAALVALVMLAGQTQASFRAPDFIGAGLGPTDRWTLEVLRTLAAARGELDGRILAEGDWRSEPVPGRRGTLRISYAFVGLSKAVDNEFVGAPAMATGLQTEYASFWLGKLLGRQITEFDANEFRTVCDLFDIRWVLTSRGTTRRHLESLAPLVSLRAQRASVAIFEVNRVASRVVSGPGRARGEGDTIEFETDRAEPSLLKYHWLPGLRAEPAAELRSVPVLAGAPVGFVEIRPPQPGHYRIRWAPGGD